MVVLEPAVAGELVVAEVPGIVVAAGEVVLLVIDEVVADELLEGADTCWTTPAGSLTAPALTPDTAPEELPPAGLFVDVVPELEATPD